MMRAALVIVTLGAFSCAAVVMLAAWVGAVAPALAVLGRVRP